jgi:hypothetical protein
MIPYGMFLKFLVGKPFVTETQAETSLNHSLQNATKLPCGNNQKLP